MPVARTYASSITQAQYTAIEKAWTRTGFAAPLTINYRQANEPPCSGHLDYACTVVDDPGDGEAATTFRHSALDPDDIRNDAFADQVESFYEETVIHEAGHAFIFNYMATTPERIATIASWFTHERTGARGQASQWDDHDDAWGERISEAAAEFFKDLYLPPQNRVFDNRTNWNFDQKHLGDWFEMVADGAGGTGGDGSNTYPDGSPINPWQ